MRIPRIYTPQTLAARVELALEPAAAHHLARVLRLRTGDELVVFNGDGCDCPSRILTSEKGQVRIRIEHCLPASPPPILEVGLLQAVGKGERMDFALQKAVELGVTRIRPLFTERTQVRLQGDRLEKRMIHWEQVVIGACEQSGRTRVPVLESPALLDADGLGMSPALRLLLAPQGGRNLREFPRPAEGVELLVGPEGGLSSAEIRLAEDAGFAPIQLGPRVLRTETAPLAAIAAVQTLWGDFCAATG